MDGPVKRRRTNGLPLFSTRQYVHMNHCSSISTVISLSSHFCPLYRHKKELSSNIRQVLIADPDGNNSSEEGPTGEPSRPQRRFLVALINRFVGIGTPRMNRCGVAELSQVIVLIIQSQLNPLIRPRP